jgi:hypothetical protein
VDEPSWHVGPHMGLLLQCNDDAPTPLAATSTNSSVVAGTHGLLEVTFTRALSRNVHQRWAQQLAAYNLNAGTTGTMATSHSPRFISEVVVKICPVDIVLPARVLEGFLLVLQPLLQSSSKSDASWKVSL